MVKGRDINPKALVIEEAHVVTAEELAQYIPLVRRIIGIVLWLVSFTGNVVAFVGGWEDITWSLSWFFSLSFIGSLLVSLLWQAFCTAIQFVTCGTPSDPIYICALVGSLVPAFIGYQPVVAFPLVEWVTGVNILQLSTLTLLL